MRIQSQLRSAARLAFVFATMVILAATPLAAQQAFSVIVHQTNPVSNLSISGLRDVFAGAVTHWPNQSRIVLAQRGSDSRANQFLMDRLLKTSWQDYKRSLESLEFRGQEPVTVRVLNSDPAACKFVFNVPTAVALIETGSLAASECRDIRVLKIDGYVAGQAGYRLK